MMKIELIWLIVVAAVQAKPLQNGQNGSDLDGMVDDACVRQCAMKLENEIQDIGPGIEQQLFLIDPSKTVQDVEQDLDVACGAIDEFSKCLDSCAEGTKAAVTENNAFVKFVCVEKRAGSFCQAFIMVNNADKFNKRCASRAKSYKEQLETLNNMEFQPNNTMALRRLGNFCKATAEAITCMNDVANQFCESQAKKIISELWKASVRNTDYRSWGTEYKECREMAETAQRLG